MAKLRRDVPLPMSPVEVMEARSVAAKTGVLSGGLALRLCDEIEWCWAQISLLRTEQEAVGRVMPTVRRKGYDLAPPMGGKRARVTR